MGEGHNSNRDKARTLRLECMCVRGVRVLVHEQLGDHQGGKFNDWLLLYICLSLLASYLPAYVSTYLCKLQVLQG